MKQTLPFLDVGALHPDDDRQLDTQFSHRGNHAFGEHVAPKDAAEDVDENGLNVLVGDQNLERVSNLIGVGASSNVQEVRGLATGDLDDIHGGHGEARAVHHAADVAVETNVVERVLRRLDLE